MASRIVVVTGASGAGKTATVERLATRDIAGLTCAFFDSIGVPTADEMPDDWQKTTTIAWVRRLAQDPARIAVLDGQTRPTFARRAFAEAGVEGRVILVECSREVRTRRLAERGQPELSNDDMHLWSAYLRGQADALDLPVIDTSELEIEQATDALIALLVD